MFRVFLHNRETSIIYFVHLRREIQFIEISWQLKNSLNWNSCNSCWQLSGQIVFPIFRFDVFLLVCKTDESLAGGSFLKRKWTQQETELFISLEPRMKFSKASIRKLFWNRNIFYKINCLRILELVLFILTSSQRSGADKYLM